MAIDKTFGTAGKNSPVKKDGDKTSTVGKTFQQLGITDAANRQAREQTLARAESFAQTRRGWSGR